MQRNIYIFFFLLVSLIHETGSFCDYIFFRLKQMHLMIGRIKKIHIVLFKLHSTKSINF